VAAGGWRVKKLVNLAAMRKKKRMGKLSKRQRRGQAAWAGHGRGMKRQIIVGINQGGVAYGVASVGVAEKMDRAGDAAWLNGGSSCSLAYVREWHERIIVIDGVDNVGVS